MGRQRSSVTGDHGEKDFGNDVCASQVLERAALGHDGI